MDNLLRWSIEHSEPHDPNQPPPQPRKDLDPGIIDAILGKPDAELMKEALAVAVDEKRNEDDRIQALDDFEMLVEQIDNANNLEKLKMWEPLQALLTSPSSSQGIQTQTLWILGTAVQNNPSAQNSYLSLSPLPDLLSFLSPTVKSAKTRSKAVYALSSLLKHSAAAVQQLQDSNGWDVLKGALQDSDITVRRKTAFLLRALLVPSTPISPPHRQTSLPAAPASATGAPNTTTAVMVHPTAPQPPPSSAPVHPNSHSSMVADPSSFSTSPATRKAFEEYGLLQALISSLTSPMPHGPDGESEGDPDFEEKVVRYQIAAYLCYILPWTFSAAQKRELGAYLQEQSVKAGADAKLAERWGLTAEEVGVLKQAVG
ncbi:Hsp70 nucleotide exchange factor FES1 [Grifola frondosa]|uniref:Hsp70 nucleotide exchange factor FES1 n=1 Tax=Grifola frondosa TaxID=5627 RepID=A0A1C7ME98_GRIFR|nr:Hsp70 nucleotide exchange factor FES1 [Grifola frondosa]